jgi:hypothetical protein
LEATTPGQEWDVLVGPRLASVPCPCISTSPYSEELWHSWRTPMQELGFEIPKHHTSYTRIHIVSWMPLVSAVVGRSFRLATNELLGLLQSITLATSPVYRSLMFCDPVFKLLADLEDPKLHIWPRLHKTRRRRKGASRWRIRPPKRRHQHEYPRRCQFAVQHEIFGNFWGRLAFSVTLFILALVVEPAHSATMVQAKFRSPKVCTSTTVTLLFQAKTK